MPLIIGTNTGNWVFTFNVQKIENMYNFSNSNMRGNINKNMFVKETK